MAFARLVRGHQEQELKERGFLRRRKVSESTEGGGRSGQGKGRGLGREGWGWRDGSI